MEGPITDSARDAVVLAALTRMDPRALRDGLQETSHSRVRLPGPVANALAALRRHRDPSSVLDRGQYRAVLPYVAAVVAEPCLSAVVDVLGEHAEDPTREQLEVAIGQVGDRFDDRSIAVMLASVADGDMEASDVCFALLDSDERYGVTGWAEWERRGSGRSVAPAPDRTADDKREVRRAKKQRAGEERRHRAEAAARAADQVRLARKLERMAASARPPVPVSPASSTAHAAPSLGRRRPVLTPLEDEEFRGDDPWAAGVVLAWIRFDPAELPDGTVTDGTDGLEGSEGLEGKMRPCVVVAGSPTHLLVRPGYSDGGVRSRDWRSVPVRYWRQSGFDQPTWIGGTAVRVPRTTEGPTAWLSADDWNALW